jgi:heptosyltransferase II
MKILIVAPQWIGDCVMAEPLMRLVARQHPSAHIAALAMPHIAPVLERISAINEVISAPFMHRALQLAERRSLGAILRAQEFQLAYVLPNSLKSALVPFFARIPKRIGYTGEARLGLLTNRVANPPKKNPDGSAHRPLMTAHYAQLALAEGAKLSVDDLQPLLAKPREVSKQGDYEALDFIALCPGAEYGPAKQWPITHFRRLANLATESRLAVLVLGGAKDAEAGEQIVSGVRGAENLCGKTTLSEAIEILSLARGVASNDSGLMHIAAALARPTIGIYGSTNPHHTPPAAHRAETLWLGTEQMPCSPCFERECPLAHLNCLRRIEPALVWERLEKLMHKAAADTRPPMPWSP